MACCPHCSKPLLTARKLLTNDERAVFDLIAARAKLGLVPETYEAMRLRLGWSSKSTIARHIAALEAKGWISVQPGKQQSAEIVGRPS